jgi:DNA polymerase III alpha subunit
MGEIELSGGTHGCGINQRKRFLRSNGLYSGISPAGLEIPAAVINDPGKHFSVTGNYIRVPLIRAKGLTERAIQKLLSERKLAPFISLSDFHRRVQPQLSEIEIIIRAGGFHEFSQPQIKLFLEAQQLFRTIPATQSLEFDFNGKIRPVETFFTEQPKLLREPAYQETGMSRPPT